MRLEVEVRGHLHLCRHRPPRRVSRAAGHCREKEETETIVLGTHAHGCTHHTHTSHTHHTHTHHTHTHHVTWKKLLHIPASHPIHTPVLLNPSSSHSWQACWKKGEGEERRRRGGHYYTHTDQVHIHLCPPLCCSQCFQRDPAEQIGLHILYPWSVQTADHMHPPVGMEWDIVEWNGIVAEWNGVLWNGIVVEWNCCGIEWTCCGMELLWNRMDLLWNGMEWLQKRKRSRLYTR